MGSHPDRNIHPNGLTLLLPVGKIRKGSASLIKKTKNGHLRAGRCLARRCLRATTILTSASKLVGMKDRQVLWRLKDPRVPFDLDHFRAGML